MSAARFLVSGRVQGVAFRAHACREAQALGLTGHARNLEDGRVDVAVFGDAGAIDVFARWLAHGPPLARVDNVSRIAPDTGPVPRGFSVG